MLSNTYHLYIDLLTISVYAIRTNIIAVFKHQVHVDLRKVWSPVSGTVLYLTPFHIWASQGLLISQ